MIYKFAFKYEKNYVFFSQINSGKILKQIYRCDYSLLNSSAKFIVYSESILIFSRALQEAQSIGIMIAFVTMNRKVNKKL